MSIYYKHRQCDNPHCDNPAFYTVNDVASLAFCRHHLIKSLTRPQTHELLEWIVFTRPLEPEEYLIECHVPDELENQIIELNQRVK